MKKLSLALIMLLPFFAVAQYTYQNLQPDLLKSAEKEKMYSFDKLRIYPVYAKESFKKNFAGVGKYMSLFDALSKNKVRITEKTNGGTVNTLIVENLSTDTIIIISGDLVKGGKQDRIIQKDVLLEPKSGKKNLPVYCVESGRWQEENRQSRSISYTAPAVFNEYKEKGAVGLRKVVAKEEDQQKVWDKVEELNKTNKTESSTKTYNALTNSATYKKDLDAYVSFFKNKFSDPSIIGVIVVTGDKIIGCDMFATHDIFAAQFNSLLHSYASEAILNGKPLTISPAAIKGFSDKLYKDEQAQAELVKEKGNDFKTKSGKLRVSVFE